MNEQEMWQKLRDKRRIPQQKSPAPNPSEPEETGRRRTPEEEPGDRTVRWVPDDTDEDADHSRALWPDASGTRDPEQSDDFRPETRKTDDVEPPRQGLTHIDGARSSSAFRPPPPVSAPSFWPGTLTAGAADDETAEKARNTLRAALQAFQQQQGEEKAVADAQRGVPPPPRRAPSRAERTQTDEPRSIKPEEPAPQEVREALEYLAEVLTDYERFVQNIGQNEFTAPMLLYYRDEVQDLLDFLTEAQTPNMQKWWQRTVEADNVLRAHSQDFVDEVGWANFKQYQIINDPPRQNWWWFLNRETRAPAPPPPIWQFWKGNS